MTQDHDADEERQDELGTEVGRNTYTPATDLAAANGINALARSLGSTLASAVGGSILASMTMALGGFEIPSLKAYRVLFVICAVAAVAAALLGLIASRTKVPQEHTQPVVETV
ncbi:MULTISPECIES: MFS transporter [unclassified Streptomyces]|uniref:MFS transporter n=1 Tax=unclassified Streptomyces TaxID=2593676 RepID=UPI0013B7E90F|nr:MFS transporter [Streptomyces sp. SID14446]NEB35247.1 MFS transporter [Streptomyces sp. SID14446]